MVKNLKLLSLIMGLSLTPLQGSFELPQNIAFREDDNVDTLDLLADLVASNPDTLEQLANMIAVADSSHQALGDFADDAELQKHVEGNLMDKLQGALSLLMLDADIARGLASEAGKNAKLESSVLTDLIDKDAGNREAYVGEMVSKRGQARALLQELVALRAAIVDWLNENRPDATDAYKDVYEVAPAREYI